jgi:beta-N-acetylhexosaminidase
MYKKMILMILLIVFLGALFFLFFVERDSDHMNQPPTSSEDPLESDENEDIDGVPAIEKIFSLAKKGMIIGAPFVAGLTEYDEVTKQYGEPQQMDKTAVGDFAAYPTHGVTVGFHDSIAFDLRSSDNGLQDIHYQEILDELGDPHETKYYQDAEYDQIILIYQVNSKFQLKWVLDKPDDHDQNPSVHHISVVAMESAEKNQGDISSLKIPELIENMSLDEKLGQMIFAGISGTEPNLEDEHLINKYKVGGVIFNKENLSSPSQTVAFINHLKAENISKIPLFFGIDQEGGRISKLPGDLIDIPANLEIGEKSSSNPSFSYEVGSVLGKLVRSYGFNVNFAPVLDINSNPENPVIGDRSFGSKPNLVSKLGIQTMKGMQSENIIPTIKHFPGHGDTSVDSHLELPVVNKTKAELEELELIPFKRAIDEGAEMVMIAHILLPKIDPEHPSSMSQVIITKLLRNQLGFEGVVITDDMTMEAITGNYDIGSAAVMSVKAGSDIIMVAHDYEKVIKVISELKSAVERGEISEERINQSVARILQLKQKYHLKDSFNDEVNINKLNQLIDSVLKK